MTIFTMYCQCIVFTLNHEQIYMQQKHACVSLTIKFYSIQIALLA